MGRWSKNEHTDRHTDRQRFANYNIDVEQLTKSARQTNPNVEAILNFFHVVDSTEDLEFW